MVSSATDVPRQAPQKSYHTILEQHVRQAHEELERPAGALLLSGLSAGLDLGFGPFLMAVIATLTSRELPHSITQILTSLAYAVGFIFAITLTTFVIGIAGFHHSIAGTIEVLMAVFSNSGPTIADYPQFLLWSVLGNTFGGAIFVALLKFGQFRAS